jgi:hypothetical protein
MAICSASMAPARLSAIDALKNSPMFKSLFNTGQEAVLQNASATGGLRGGNTEHSLYDLGSNTLSQLISEQISTGSAAAGFGESSLIMKYPEFADKIKSGWDVKDNASKQADLTQLGEVYSAAASGNWSLALKQAQARVDADKAAGKADPEDQAFVDQITAAEGGDENARKGVLTTLGTHIAAVSGPEHFATVYGALKGGYTLGPATFGSMIMGNRRPFAADQSR